MENNTDFIDFVYLSNSGLLTFLKIDMIVIMTRKENLLVHERI